MSSKNLKTIKAAGLVIRKRNWLYTITSGDQPVPGEPLLG
jgi:hypothetical protein